MLTLHSDMELVWGERCTVRLLNRMRTCLNYAAGTGSDLGRTSGSDLNER